MITEDELKKYLPKYLSEENYKTLLAELKSFPYNIDGRMYTSMLDKNVIFQGDGLKKMPIIDLVNIERGVKNVSCLILSNTCDMDLSNSRMFPASIMYAPIIISQHIFQFFKNKVLIVAKLKTTFQISNNKK